MRFIMKMNSAVTITLAVTKQTDSSAGGVKEGRSAFIVPRVQVSGGTKSRIAAIHKIIRCAIMAYIVEKAEHPLLRALNLKNN